LFWLLCLDGKANKAIFILYFALKAKSDREASRLRIEAQPDAIAIDIAGVSAHAHHKVIAQQICQRVQQMLSP